MCFSVTVVETATNNTKLAVGFVMEQPHDASLRYWQLKVPRWRRGSRGRLCYIWFAKAFRPHSVSLLECHPLPPCF
jgi:hypothetical protein